jgi:subtilase family serine protease
MSYGEAETSNGATANYSYYATFQQAVAEGVSIFVSSGDWDAATEDFGNVVTDGIGVSGFTSTPYNVSVGGLDFSFLPDGVPSATYFSNTNRPDYSSALSYIQEIPWNNSCAGGVTAGFEGKTPLGLCNNPAVTSPTGELSFLLNAVGGSGGPSGCATGVPSYYTPEAVSGTCAGYPKPNWQKQMLGNPSDGVRDIPDVSLFASNGFWGTYYVACWTNPAGGFPPCLSSPPSAWSGWGGTSISSPIMAGIQALINEKTGSRWGNPNTVYYALANAEYNSTNGAAYCNSTTVPKTGSPCIFYDITQGDNVGVCKASSFGFLINCYKPGGGVVYGVLSTSLYYDQPAYPATTGWDFTSGIGSVNAWNLLENWPSPAL